MKRIRSWLGSHLIDLNFTESTASLADAFAHQDNQDATPASLRISFDIDRHFVDNALKTSGPGIFRDRRTHKLAWLCANPPTIQTLSFDYPTGLPSALGTFVLGYAKDLDGNVRTRPGIDIISAWAAAKGMLPIHASGIALGGCALILLGIGGSGKTTTALALAQRGWELLGDDRCFLYRDGSQIKVAGLYSTAYLTSESLLRLKVNDWPNLGSTHHGKHARSLPSTGMAATAKLVGAVWVSPNTQNLYKLEPLNRREALIPWQLGLSPTLQALGPSSTLLKNLSDFSQSIPAWRFGLDWNFDQIDQSFRDLVTSKKTDP